MGNQRSSLVFFLGAAALVVCAACGSSKSPDSSACPRPTDTPLDCGACGNTCPGYGATATVVTCQDGATCTFACDGDNYDVDGDPTNGCEVPGSSICPRPTDTPLDCGACNNTCPGYGTSAALVTCDTGATCTFACAGANYDVDGDPSNGCEVLDDASDNHTQLTATDLGSLPCTDADGSSFTGSLVSDARTHTPSVSGFDATVGAAPRFWKLYATGGFSCVNDYEVTLQTSGGGSTACYQVSVITDIATAHSQAASGSGSVTLSAGPSSYSDDTTVYLKVEKTCPLPTQESVSFTVNYHL